eukprot:6905689-Prymnesium_polylepis.1
MRTVDWAVLDAGGLGCSAAGAPRGRIGHCYTAGTGMQALMQASGMSRKHVIALPRHATMQP